MVSLQYLGLYTIGRARGGIVTPAGLDAKRLAVVVCYNR